MTVPHSTGEIEDKPFRVIGDPEHAGGPFVFACEHASNTVPNHRVSTSDRLLLDDHWGWDIGAGDLVRALCQQLDCVGVLSTRSRLVIDVNRRPESKTLIVSSCAGQPVSFNQQIGDEDRAWRQSIYDGYHRGLDGVLTRRLSRSPVHLVSMHSFTPVWQGRQRELEVGILFDRYEDDAREMASVLSAQGMRVELNEPYSGLTGELMYAPTRHGQKHNIPYIEFEIRQDLISTPEGIAETAARLLPALSVFRP